MSTSADAYRAPMAPWPSLAPYGRTVELPQGPAPLFFYDSGPSPQPALLLIHGLGDEADTWRHLFLPLSRHYRVVAPDLPGFGRSALPPRALTPPYLCRVLVDLMDRLEIGRASLIGSSLGGLLAHELALTHTPRVAHLVLIAGSLATRTRSVNLATLLMLIPGLGEWLYTRLRRDPLAAYETLAPYYRDLAALPEADRSFLLQRVNQRVWSDVQRRAFFSVLRSLAGWLPRRQRTLSDELARLPVPTLALWGEHDRIVPPAVGRSLTRLQPSATFHLLPGAGHLPQQEEPLALLQILQGFTTGRPHHEDHSG